MEAHGVLSPEELKAIWESPRSRKWWNDAPRLRLHVEAQAARIAELERALACVHTHQSDSEGSCACGLSSPPNRL